MAGLIDGLGGEELAVSGLQAGGVSISPYIVGSITATSIVKGASIEAVGSVVDANGTLTSNATGSPYTYGKAIRAGTGTLGAGSTAWVTFPTAFTTTPTVVLATNTKTINGVIATGSISVGSFVAFGETASDTFNWLAI